VTDNFLTTSGRSSETDQGLVQGLGLLPLSTEDYTKVSSGEVPEARINAYLVRSDILAIEIDTQVLIWGEQVPYVAQESDVRYVSNDGQTRWIVRNGKDYGYLVGKDEIIIRTLDYIVGEPLDFNWADQSGSYLVSSTTDTNFSSGVKPVTTIRKTEPIGYAKEEVQSLPTWGSYSTIYLDFDQDLDPNQTYQISFLNSQYESIDFQLTPGVTESEAIHVSQVGFRPDDPAKQAYLSTWMADGQGVTYGGGQTFSLVDTTTNQVVYQGKTALQKAKDDPDPYKGRNYAGTDVYIMDFSDFTRPGTYRVYVEGVGSSMTFKIDGEVWADAYYTSARGFYYQRSGIAIEEPYAEGYTRPSNFNPNEGVKIYQSTTSYLDVIDGSGDIFGELVAGRTDELVSEAYGGYYDAGDWDRNITHLSSSRSMIELVDLFPDYYDDLSLNIPESNNDLPDTLDEALWGLDLYRRLQKSDGGIPGGIESSEHPRTGETSWQESNEVFVYAPDAYSSYIYAATAAQAAYVLERYDPALAAVYRESALRAMEYAEREFLAAGGASKFRTEVSDERNLASVYLYRATGDTRWHDLFLATTAFTNPEAQVFEFQKHNQRDAAYVYASLNMPGIDLEVKENAKEAFLEEADFSVWLGANTSFNWTQENAYEPNIWGGGFGSPNTGNILRAYDMTGKQQYLNAAIKGTGVAFGANPENTSYTTGIGQRYPEYPLVVNDWSLGQKSAPGITVYGPNDPQRLGDYFIYDWLVNDQVLNTDPQALPPLESFLDVYLAPAWSEYTIAQSMTPTVYTLGFLAAREATTKTALPQPEAAQDVALIQAMVMPIEGEPGSDPNSNENSFSNEKLTSLDNTSVDLERLILGLS
jgi:endoglucanase